MKFIKSNLFFILLLSVSFLTLTSCEEDNSTKTSLNYVSFEDSAKSVSFLPGENGVAEILVYAASKSGSDRSFTVVVNEEATTMSSEYYSVPSTVTIPANTNVGTLAINVTANDLGSGQKIVLSLVEEGGVYTGGSITLNVFETCNRNLVRINLTFDDYAEENWWELYDAAGNLLANTVEGDYAGQVSASLDVCLDSGEYHFVIYDAYGDGFCCAYGNGSYVLTLIGEDGTNTVLVEGAEFGAEEISTFTLP